MTFGWQVKPLRSVAPKISPGAPPAPCSRKQFQQLADALGESDAPFLTIVAVRAVCADSSGFNSSRFNAAINAARLRRGFRPRDLDGDGRLL